MNKLSFAFIILIASLGAYISNGGLFENLGTLYKRYKDSKLSIKDFLLILSKKPSK